MPRVKTRPVKKTAAAAEAAAEARPWYGALVRRYDACAAWVRCESKQKSGGLDKSTHIFCDILTLDPNVFFGHVVVKIETRISVRYI